MWKESYRVGVESVDAQHIQLFEMVEGLLDIVRAERTDIKEECNKAIEFLKDYVIKHFDDEEAYLEAVAYEGIEAHKLIHRDFINTVLAYDANIKKSNYDLAVIKQFSGMLTTWLIYHVAGEDRRYVEGKDGKIAPHIKTYEDGFELSMQNIFSTIAGVSIDGVKKACLLDCEDERLFVNVGLKGNSNGRATFMYPKQTAFSLIENMTSMQVNVVDDLVVSALCEVANIVSGNAASVLAASGMECDITTPEFSTNPEAVEGRQFIHFSTELGEVGVAISMS